MVLFLVLSLANGATGRNHHYITITVDLRVRHISITVKKGIPPALVRFSCPSSSGPDPFTLKCSNGSDPFRTYTPGGLP